jgi:hypothetical protein
MNIIVPVTIMSSLGVGSGLILRFWFSNKWLISILAGILTVFLWGLGMHVLFSLTESDATGATHYQGMLYVFLIGFFASLAASCFVRKKDLVV